MTTSKTQDRILDAAVALFNDRGVKEVSVNLIADAAEVSRGNLHYHFRTKSEIIAALFERMSQEMERDGAIDLSNPTAENLRAIFERYSGWVWSYRFFFRELTALTNRDPVLRHRYYSNRNKRLARLERLFQGLIERGLMVRPTPPVTVQRLVTLSWITSDNWLSFLEAQGQPVDQAWVEEGFALVMCIFRPYLKS